jgi:hypothetical protein
MNAPCARQFALVYQCKLANSFNLCLYTIYFDEIVSVEAKPEVCSEKLVPDLLQVDL